MAAIVLAYEADNGSDGDKAAMLSLHLFFTTVFNVELGLKILAFGFFTFLDDFYNRLDFIIVFASDVVDILSIAEVINSDSKIGNYVLLGRTVRIFRLARLSHMLSDLEAIINSFFDAIQNVFWAVMLASLFVMSCAIVTTSWFGADPRLSAAKREQWWGSTSNSMYTLVQIMTGEWVDVTTETGDSIAGAYLFLLIFNIICGLGVMALFNAIFVESLQEAKLENDREMERKRNDAKEQLQADLKMLLHAADGAFEEDQNSGNTKNASFTHEEIGLVARLLETPTKDDKEPAEQGRGNTVSLDESDHEEAMRRFREEIEAKGSVIDMDLEDIRNGIRLACDSMHEQEEDSMQEQDQLDFGEVLDVVFSMDQAANKKDHHLVLKKLRKFEERQNKMDKKLHQMDEKLDGILKAVTAAGAKHDSTQ